MPRKPRPLNRDLGVVRDASLIVIASEDRYAVHAYFSRFQPTRVQFRVLPTENGASAPGAILDRLDRFDAEYQIGEDDQLWYCGDTDHWTRPNHLPNLLAVIQRCEQSGYYVSLSHPCFELWLLLHFSDLPPGIATTEQMIEKIKEIAGGYSKQRGCKTPITSSMILDASRRAELLDQNSQKIPISPTTRVYQILKLLIDREAISLKSIAST